VNAVEVGILASLCLTVGFLSGAVWRALGERGDE